MKRKLQIMFLSMVVLFVLYAANIVYATGDERYFVDDYGVVSTEQAKAINQQLLEYSEKNKMDFVVVFVDDSFSGSSSEYQNNAESYFLDGGYGFGKEQTGMMMTVDMTQRKIDVRAFGKAINVFEKDSNIDKITDKVGSRLREGDYKGAVDWFAKKGRELYVAKNGNFFQRLMPKLFSFTSIIVALVVALIATFIGYSSHNSIVKTESKKYEKEGSFALIAQEDNLWNKNVTTRIIQRSTSGSGSSGGGGGRSSGGTRGF